MTTSDGQQKDKQPEPTHIEDMLKTDLTMAVKNLETFSAAIDAKQTEISLLCGEWNRWLRGKEDADREIPKTEETRIRRALLLYLSEMKNIADIHLDLSTLAAAELFRVSSRTEMIRKVLQERLRPHYEIDEAALLSEGNSSISFPITSVLTDRKFVAMVLKIDKLTGDLKSQINRISRLKHRNIIKMMSSGPEDQLPFYLLTEYVNGLVLSDILKKLGPRPTTQAIPWLLELMDAMEYLRQKQVQHTNIRPSKIFIDEEQHPMISPFDIIKWGSDGRSMAKFIEDSRYISPEKLALGINEMLPEEDLFFADQFSLGLVAYRILTGQDLFLGKSIPEIIRNRDLFSADRKYRTDRLGRLPNKYWVAMLDKMLKDDKNHRFPDFRRLREALYAIEKKVGQTDCSVRQSYRRCLSNNKEFIRDFYQLFFDKAKHTGIKEHFLNLERQQSMFQMALDIIIDIEQKEDFLKDILTKETEKPKEAEKPAPNIHVKNGYTIQDYTHFLDALLETVERTEKSNWKKVAPAWNQLREKNIAVIQKILASRTHQQESTIVQN